ncbi:mitochondrial import inner membrane translocase subunit TIM10 [Acrasis kona]|uniref:Mitochondrial import inner membrane translocase subunit n=1 Tax=Acrasis kona TaxID=1008807 RepID=A0AAW2ZG90_9EUKA
MNVNNLSPTQYIVLQNSKDGLNEEKARVELDSMKDLYQSFMSTCYQRCLTMKFAAPEIQSGEGRCLHRCVQRYMHAYNVIGEVYDKEYTKIEETME